MTPTEKSASRMRTWREEADMLLSLLDCFVPERETVFASSEFFTGKRFYDLCLENEARTPEELEKKLGPEYKISVLTKNKEQGRAFARKIRELGHKIVLTPVVFNVSDLNDGRNWCASGYMGFWEVINRKKVYTVCFKEFLQF